MAHNGPEEQHFFSGFHWLFETPGLRISEGILQYRFLILSVICLLLAASVYQVFRLRADFSFEAIMLADDEEATFFAEFRDRFEEAGRDIIVLRGTDEGLEIEALDDRLSDGRLEMAPFSLPAPPFFAPGCTWNPYLHAHHTADRRASDCPDHLDACRGLPRAPVFRLQGHPRPRTPEQRRPHIFSARLSCLSAGRIEHAEAMAS